MALNEYAWQRKLAKKRKKKVNGKSQRRTESYTATQAVRRHVPGISEPVAFLSYEVTDEPMPDPLFDRLPVDVQEQINSLHEQVLKARPIAALEVLEILIKQYPDIAKLYNYLFIAHYNMGNKDEASRVLQETVRRFPDYLFGRLSLAELYLNQGQADKVNDVFEGKFDLKLLYPERERFHSSEVLSFQSVLVRYYHAQGNRVQALSSFNLMRQLDPNHHTTRLVGRVIFAWRFSAWLQDKLKRIPFVKHVGS